VIPLEFVFYDEMNEKIKLDQYISSENEFAKIIGIRSIKTTFKDQLNNSVYK